MQWLSVVECVVEDEWIEVGGKTRNHPNKYGMCVCKWEKLILNENCRRSLEDTLVNNNGKKKKDQIEWMPNRQINIYTFVSEQNRISEMEISYFVFYFIFLCVWPAHKCWHSAPSSTFVSALHKYYIIYLLKQEARREQHLSEYMYMFIHRKFVPPQFDKQESRDSSRAVVDKKKHEMPNGIEIK